MAKRVRSLAGEDVLQDCFALECQTLRKSQGAWRMETEVMFPGYVFVAANDVEALQERLRLSTQFAHLLGADKRVFSLRPQEAAFVRDFGGANHTVAFSRGVIENGRTVIGEGPLRGRAHLIKKIDRHKRVAYLDLGLLDQPQVRVGLEITSKT